MWLDALTAVVALPRSKRRAALDELCESNRDESPEDWNTAFGRESLYDAWSQTPPMLSLYAANHGVLRPFLDSRRDCHIVEIGGGNGALWGGFFGPEARGSFTLIDPVQDAHRAVATRLPEGIEFHSRVTPVEQAEMPGGDVVVCSLMLHHVAGLDAEQRYAYGLTGPGKHEILQRILASIQPQDGICILNESDVYTEIDLPPDGPILIDRLIDSYVTRAGLAVAQALESADLDPSLRRRLKAVLLHWCLDQVERAGTCSRADRDVYELDTPRWRTTLERAGAQLISHRFTDDWHLFHQWVFRSPGQ
ncbi:MAG: class I SAM-dependent methyltransferase [Candidatus Latescibacteria bacterium]|jgi:hypothetical protein|nr:class I SAM-dependent methyltransferase [Candidatus Latescibacterota bacterium]